MKSSLESINSNNIEDVAFVFHTDILEHVLVNCAGMRNVFFTRFKYDSANQLIAVNRDDHLPFNCNFGISFPKRIWHSILIVKEKLKVLMNHRRQLQQCRQSETIPFSLEAWVYFIKRLTPSTLFHSFLKVQSKKKQYCDLSLETKAAPKTFELLRVENESSFTCARELLGLTLSIEVRSDPPKKVTNQESF